MPVVHAARSRRGKQGPSRQATLAAREQTAGSNVSSPNRRNRWGNRGETSNSGSPAQSPPLGALRFPEQGFAGGSSSSSSSDEYAYNKKSDRPSKRLQYKSIDQYKDELQEWKAFRRQCREECPPICESCIPCGDDYISSSSDSEVEKRNKRNSWYEQPVENMPRNQLIENSDDESIQFEKVTQPIPRSHATPPDATNVQVVNERTGGVVSACASSNAPLPVDTAVSGQLVESSHVSPEVTHLVQTGDSIQQVGTDENNLALAVIDDGDMPELIDAPQEKEEDLGLPIDYTIPEERLKNPLGFLPDNLQKLVSRTTSKAHWRENRRAAQHTLDVEQGEWSKREGHQMVTLPCDDEMKQDLKEWRKHKSWAQRHCRLVEHMDSILLFGGRSTEGHLNDVWSGTWKHSNNGGAFLRWACVNKKAPWSARCDFAACVFREKGKNGIGRVILMGGDSAIDQDDSQEMGDVWRSDDGGKSWKCSTPCALWDARSGHAACIVPSKGTRGGYDRILMTGGWTAGSTEIDAGRFADVWQCEDTTGAQWSMLPPPPWKPRSEHRMVCNKAGVVVIAGGTHITQTQLTRTNTQKEILHSTTCMKSMLGSGLFDDIWTSEDGGYSWSEVRKTGMRWNARRGHGLLIVEPDPDMHVKNSVFGKKKDGTEENKEEPSASSKSPRASGLKSPTGARGSFARLDAFAHDPNDGGVTSPREHVRKQIEQQKSGSTAQAASSHLTDCKILVFGGWTQRGRVANDCWISGNGGEHWQPASTSCQWAPRELFRSVLYEGLRGRPEIILTGGRDEFGSQLDCSFKTDENGNQWQSVATKH